MLRRGDFRPLSIDDIGRIRELYSRHPVEHSDYLPALMLAWQHFMDYEIAWLKGSLVILTAHDGKVNLRPPIGPWSKDDVEEVLSLSRELDAEHMLSMVGPEAKRAISTDFPELKFSPRRDFFDYIYLASDLTELPGKRYLNTRNYLNKFRRECPHSVERIGRDNISEVRDFLHRWCVQKGCGDDRFLMAEREATSFSLEHMFELGLEGLLIRTKGNVEAFSLFEHMNEEMAVIHYEKANSDIPGLYQAINNEAARYLCENYRFINRESDMGVPGLRQVKERYGPCRMLEVHFAR